MGTVGFSVLRSMSHTVHVILYERGTVESSAKVELGKRIREGELTIADENATRRDAALVSEHGG